MLGRLYLLDQPFPKYRIAEGGIPVMLSQCQVVATAGVRVVCQVLGLNGRRVRPRGAGWTKVGGFLGSGREAQVALSKNPKALWA